MGDSKIIDTKMTDLRWSTQYIAKHIKEIAAKGSGVIVSFDYTAQRKVDLPQNQEWQLLEIEKI